MHLGVSSARALCGGGTGVFSQASLQRSHHLAALLHHPRPALGDGKTDKWGKNGDRKAICEPHKFLCLRCLSSAMVTASYYLESGKRCFPINMKWVGVCGLSPATRLCWLFTARLRRPCSGSYPGGQLTAWPRMATHS